VRTAALALVLVALLTAASARASIWIANGARDPQLRVDARGSAEVRWRDEHGAVRTLLVPPRGKLLPGGRISGRDVSRTATDKTIPMRVLVRRTPDGRSWALQAWRPLPHGPIELHLSRWRGAPTRIEPETPCCPDGRLRGTVAFGGRPVYGYSPTPEGKRIRSLAYVDFARQGGWRRAVGVFLRPPSGSFTLFLQARWRSTRYRITVAGPNRGTTLAPDARVVVPAETP
jgi:hypothetical protein